MYPSAAAIPQVNGIQTISKYKYLHRRRTRHKATSTTWELIGTMYRNYHCPALIITFIFPDLLPKILRTSSQGRTCPTQTDTCLIKHHSKQPIGAPRLNLVPATPKLYKVAFHHVLVGIPTYKVTTTVLVLNSKESTTTYTAYSTVLVDSKDHRHIVIGLI